MLAGEMSRVSGWKGNRREEGVRKAGRIRTRRPGFLEQSGLALGG